MAEKKQDNKKGLAVRRPRTARQLPARQTDDFFGLPFLPAWWGGSANEDVMWAPAIHVLEKDNKFVAKVELPGVHEEDVNVYIMGDMLVVEGEKEAESEVKKKGYSYSETSYGSFSRSIALPSVIDIDNISANFDKGVLEIDLPKAVEIKPKKVVVTARKKAKATPKETAAAGKK